MSLTCLTCRTVVEPARGSGVGACPRCGGPLAGEEGPWVEWVSPEGTGMMVLPVQGLSIGRNPENDLALKDRRVSKIHAVIFSDGDRWYLRDTGSANGTFVGGQRVVEWELNEGDPIAIGVTQIRFHAGGAPRGISGISIQPVIEPTIRASLVCEPGDFRPEGAITDERELRADYERLRAAYLFNRYVGNEHDQEALLRRILELAFELLPADRGAILLREEEGAPLIPALARHRDSGLAEIVIPDSILRTAVEERRAVLSGDATADLRFQGSESVLRESVRSAMCVPLVGRNEVLGAIHLDTHEQTGAFSVKDLLLLSVLAGQAALAIERFHLHRRLEREAEAKDRLSRFLSPEVLREVVERGLDLSGEGRTDRVTVLFCDIRGFTALAESMPPTALVRLLNAYFERMVDVVFRHGGVLDKFIGDAVMAVWGAPLRRRNDARRAVLAGREMLEAVALFNQGSSGQGWPKVAVGIGVNSGEAVIGTVGSSRRMEYTVMGDAVNLAERLCSMAAAGQLLVSEETLRDTAAGGMKPPRARPLPPARVRGRKGAVKVYEVLDG